MISKVSSHDVYAPVRLQVMCQSGISCCLCWVMMHVSSAVCDVNKTFCIGGRAVVMQ